MRESAVHLRKQRVAHTLRVGPPNVGYALTATCESLTLAGVAEISQRRSGEIVGALIAGSGLNLRTALVSMFTSNREVLLVLARSEIDVIRGTEYRANRIRCFQLPW